MRQLITGGAGFIGSHLADRLVARGDEVIILDDLSTGSRRNVEPLLAADAADVAGQAFNIACGDRISLNGLLGELRSIVGTDVEADYQEARAGDILHSLADLPRAREAFGYEPAIGIREGLERTVAALSAG